MRLWNGSSLQPWRNACSPEDSSQSHGRLRRRNGTPTVIGCLLFLLLLPPTLRGDETFRFVQLTDLHIDGGTDHVQRVTRAVDAINALPMPIEFVLVTGDLVNNNITNSNTVRRLTSLLRRLHPTVHVLPGNHDTVPKRWPETTNAYVQALGPMLTTFTCHGVVFLLLADETLHDTRLAAEHSDYKPMEWLEAQLRATTNQPVIVVHHRPCVEDFHDNTLHAGWPQPTRDRWTELVNRYRVSAEIAGHFHRDELYWVGNVPLYVAAPIAGYYGRQASFRLYEWRDGHLSYRTVYLR